MNPAIRFIGIISLCFFSLSVSQGRGPTVPDRPSIRLSDHPLYFIPNHGQVDSHVLYYARAGGSRLWLTGDGLVFDQGTPGERGDARDAVSTLQFEGAAADVQVTAIDPTEYRESYFYGRDESDWITDLPTSRAVFYQNLYDGIDLKVYGTEAGLEYDWIVRPGADPDRIRFVCAGASRASINREGNLVVASGSGAVTHRKPSSYQTIDGRRTSVSASFRSDGAGRIGFAVGAYDPRFELVIDPLVLDYSTYLGGEGNDNALAAFVDADGNIYLTGNTQSPDFPPVKSSHPRKDLFITKISADGQNLIYSAFFPVLNIIYSNLAVDKTGAVYLVNQTDSIKFPVKNALQPQYGGGEADAFVLKLAPSGHSLEFSTYLGGSGYDSAIRVAVDGRGDIYVAGSTSSQNFPTKKPFQPALKGLMNCFIAKIRAGGKSLVYSTFFGTNTLDYCAALSVNSEGAAMIAGHTMGRGLPVKNAFQKQYRGGSYDCFFAKLAPAGDSLIYASYLGSSNFEMCNDSAQDDAGCLYILGITSGNFPLKNPFQKTRKGGYDGFLTKISSSGDSLVYSTYLGGSDIDVPTGLAVGADGRVYVCGGTKSANFPVKDAFQDVKKRNYDGFLSIFSSDGRKLLVSTFLGGSYEDAAREIALAGNGGIYLVGTTKSPDFPVLNPYSQTLAGRLDTFILKFRIE
jgi:hypothetical protein